MKKNFMYRRQTLCVFFSIFLSGAFVNAETLLFTGEKAAHIPQSAEIAGRLASDSGLVPHYETSGNYSQFAVNTYFCFSKTHADNYTPIPESGVFFIVPSGSIASVRPVVAALLEECRRRTFETTVTVIMTGGDTSVLPDFYQSNIPAGIKHCAGKIEPSNSCVFVLTGSRESGITVGAGAAGVIAPIKLAERLSSLFQAANQPFSFTTGMAERYYLNWNKADPYLEEFVKKNIPAMSVAIGDPVLENETAVKRTAAILATLAETAVADAENSADRHYLFLRDGGAYLFITENNLVHIAVYSCLAALFFIFTSGVFKKRKEIQNMTVDILHTWWLVPLYFCITVFSLVAAKVIVLQFFISLTGNQDVWSYAPLAGLIMQMAVTALLLSLLPVIEQMAYFPDRSSIYGYLSSLAALCNVLIFMSVEFSLTTLFVWSYLCSFIFYHCKKTPASIFWTIMMYLPLGYTVAGMDIQDIARLFAPDFTLNDLPRYVFPAFILLPLELNVARIKALNGKMGKTAKFRLPVTAIIVAPVVAVLAVWLCLQPIFTAERPLKLHIGYMLNGNDANITAVSPYTLPEMEITVNGVAVRVPAHSGTNIFSQKTNGTAQFFQAECTRRTILERSTNKITLQPLHAGYPPLRYDITVINRNGTAVYDATIPYELRENGTQCLFMPGEYPGDIFSFEFSGSKDDVLIVQIRGLFATQPGDISVKAAVPVVYTGLIDSVQTIVLEPDKK